MHFTILGTQISECINAEVHTWVSTSTKYYCNICTDSDYIQCNSAFNLLLLYNSHERNTFKDKQSSKRKPIYYCSNALQYVQENVNRWSLKYTSIRTRVSQHITVSMYITSVCTWVSECIAVEVDYSVYFQCLIKYMIMQKLLSSYYCKWSCHRSKALSVHEGITFPTYTMFALIRYVLSTAIHSVCCWPWSHSSKYPNNLYKLCL